LIQNPAKTFVTFLFGMTWRFGIAYARIWEGLKAFSLIVSIEECTSAVVGCRRGCGPPSPARRIIKTFMQNETMEIDQSTAVSRLRHGKQSTEASASDFDPFARWGFLFNSMFLYLSKSQTGNRHKLHARVAHDVLFYYSWRWGKDSNRLMDGIDFYRLSCHFGNWLRIDDPCITSGLPGLSSWSITNEEASSRDFELWYSSERMGFCSEATTCFPQESPTYTYERWGYWKRGDKHWKVSQCSSQQQSPSRAKLTIRRNRQ